MSRALIWLSGFAACGAIQMLIDGDPWAAFLAAAAIVCLHLAYLNRVEAFGAVGELQGAGDALTRRSGGLRPEPCSTVSALRAPAAIARGETK